MAISQINVSSLAGENLYSDTNIGSTVDAIKGSSALLLYVIVNNSANVSASYVKLYNLAGGGVTVGSTVPDEILYVPGSATITQVYQTSANPGKVFGTALSACCVTAGGTAGTTAPSSAVSVTFAYV